MAIYGILGDIHGNRAALAAALARLADAHVESVLCVGDIADCNADSDDCVAMLRERNAVCIAGHDDSPRARRTWAPCTAQWLRALPPHRVLEDCFLLTHGGVRDVQQHVTRPRHVLENAQYLHRDFPGIQLCFFGHTGQQRVFEVDGERVCELDPGHVALRADRTYFVNPGSVDAPGKCSHKLAELAIFDSHAMTVRFARTAYGEAATRSRTREYAFPLRRPDPLDAGRARLL